MRYLMIILSAIDDHGIHLSSNLAYFSLGLKIIFTVIIVLL